MSTSELTGTWRLSAGDANAEGELSVSVLVARIIDIATDHANALGVGNPAMEHLGRGWVLSRFALEMEAYPKANEEFSLTTWVEAWNRHFSVRNFMVADADGTPLGYATSVWMVLDVNTRENAGLSHLNPPSDMLSDRKCPIARPAKHVAIGRDDANSVSTHIFRYGDLDFYRHVNTVRYVTALTDQYSLETMDEKMIHRLDMSFLREGRYSETVDLLRCDRGDDQTMFSIVDADDGEALLFASVGLLPRKRS